MEISESFQWAAAIHDWMREDLTLAEARGEDELAAAKERWKRRFKTQVPYAVRQEARKWCAEFGGMEI